MAGTCRCAGPAFSRSILAAGPLRRGRASGSWGGGFARFSRCQLGGHRSGNRQGSSMPDPVAIADQGDRLLARRQPTHLVTKPNTYAKWEFQEPLPFPYAGYTHDVAAMGRVWYLESLACARMKAWERLRTSVQRVAARGKMDN